jgi:hypothetical protein
MSTHDRTQNDSAGRTVVETGEASDFHRLESMESQKPDPNIWTTVERLDSGKLGGGAAQARHEEDCLERQEVSIPSRRLISHQHFAFSAHFHDVTNISAQSGAH